MIVLDPLLESIEPHFALFMSKLHADGCADLREHLRTFEDAINAFPVPEAPPEGALEEEMVKYTNKLKKLQGINGEKVRSNFPRVFSSLTRAKAESFISFLICPFLYP